MQVKEKIGQWFLDVSKYVFTAVFVSSFLGSINQKWILYLTSVFIVCICFFVGLVFLKNNKK